MRLFLAFALFAVSVSGQATEPAGITLSPISVTLDAKRPADAITLTNGTAENKVFQAEIMNWSHENGKDVFTSTKDMIVSPPMFRVVAGAKQVVRIGLKLRTAANSPTEKTYRLFLQEVPETAPVTSSEVGGAALRLLMRFSLPVFVKPNQPLQQAMTWKVQANKDGSLALSVSNNSNRHLKVSEVQFESAGKSVNADSFAYVFAGETYTWVLKPQEPIRTGDATVTARTDDGLVHVGLPLQAP